MKCKKCGNHFHYCTSCDSELCCELEYCSDKCMNDSVELLNDMQFFKGFFLNEISRSQITNLEKFIEIYNKYEDLSDTWIEDAKRQKLEYPSPDYICDIDEWADVMSVKDFIESCECTAFVDYDGFGYPVKDNKVADNFIIKPSTRDIIPKDATHIIWYNR